MAIWTTGTHQLISPTGHEKVAVGYSSVVRISGYMSSHASSALR
jgi:hypothetical protein